MIRQNILYFSKEKIKRFIISSLILSMLISPVVSLAAEDNQKNPHTLVAHAGGTINGYKSTNSLEALEKAYKNGFKLIEMDFQWTTDDEIVCIHDWEWSVGRLFRINPGPLSLKEFKSHRAVENLTLLDLNDLAEWLREKEDVYIVTDMKGDNIKFLQRLKYYHNDIIDKFIPQIYSFEEYDLVKELGYKDIILTLYRKYYTDNQIVNFAKNHDLFAITMASERAVSNLPRLLKDIGVTIYAHTVNELHEFENLYQNGVTGIYTDDFQPNKFAY